jgi:hypothetical protein
MRPAASRCRDLKAAMRKRIMRFLKQRPPEDWAWLALLISLGLFLLLSERFWDLLPF